MKSDLSVVEQIILHASNGLCPHEIKKLFPDVSGSRIRGYLRKAGFPPFKRGRKENKAYSKVSDLVKTKIGEGLKMSEIAKAMGVSRQAIDQIVNVNKHRTRKISQDAAKSGAITRPEKCEKCGNKSKTEMHHMDYSKPLEVIHLCKRCHSFLHKLEKIKPKTKI